MLNKFWFSEVGVINLNCPGGSGNRPYRCHVDGAETSLIILPSISARGRFVRAVGCAVRSANKRNSAEDSGRYKRGSIQRFLGSARNDKESNLLMRRSQTAATVWFNATSQENKGG